MQDKSDIEKQEPAKGTLKKIGDYTNQFTKAMSEGFEELTGSLTGKNLEKRIQEYTEIYSEILLDLHADANERKKENEEIRAEIRKLQELQKSLEDLQKGKVHNRIRTAGILGLAGFLAGITALTLSMISLFLK